MADPEHVELVKNGAAAIQAWREKNTTVRLDLSSADLSRADLRGADLSRATLSWANLIRANLSVANLSVATLSEADLSEADLTRANLSAAYLSEADLSGADLSGANLYWAKLRRANLSGANLSGANVEGALVASTTFAGLDLSAVLGLGSVQHYRPSEIGVQTIYKSRGKIPESFLRGCGVPEALIANIPALIEAMQPIQYPSCFISYSSQDDEFARRLFSRMRDEELRVWFAPEQMRGGQKIIEQIDRAIQVNDRLLVVLSDESMASNWVQTEIKRARTTERRDKRQKLFPIRLVKFEHIRDWKCIDPKTGEDLAAAICEYLIHDFSNWKDHDAFEAAFADLIRDLRAQAQP